MHAYVDVCTVIELYYYLTQDPTILQIYARQMYPPFKSSSKTPRPFVSTPYEWFLFMAKVHIYGFVKAIKVYV